MVRTPIDFIFDFGSPNAYLVHRAIPILEARHRVTFRYVPALLGGMFKLTGNQSPASAFGHIRNKPEYEAMDRERYATRYGIDDFVMNPHFPVNTMHLMRGAIAAALLGEAGYIDAVFAAMWRDGLKMDEPDVVREVLLKANLPAQAIQSVGAEPNTKSALITATETAVERGAFGSPTFFVDDRMWFGKERLAEVVEAAAH